MANICSICKTYPINTTPFRVCKKCKVEMCRYCFVMDKEGDVYCEKCDPTLRRVIMSKLVPGI